jgi:hypothetical protein
MNEQEKKDLTPQVQQEQQAMKEENKKVKDQLPPPAEEPAFNRSEHPQRQNR